MHLHSKIREESNRDCTYASSFLATILSSLSVSNRFVPSFFHCRLRKLTRWSVSKSSLGPSITGDGSLTLAIQIRRTKSLTHTLKLTLRAAPPRPQTRVRRNLRHILMPPRLWRIGATRVTSTAAAKLIVITMMASDLQDMKRCGSRCHLRRRGL